MLYAASKNDSDKIVLCFTKLAVCGPKNSGPQTVLNAADPNQNQTDRQTEIADRQTIACSM